MKMSRIYFILLLVMVSSPLFSLDIYFNDILWHSYQQEDLESLQIDFSGEKNSRDTAIPFMELLPLMSDVEGIGITIPSGDILLSIEAGKLRDSRLTVSDAGLWDLSLNNSLYHDPQRIEIYGKALENRKLIIWAEPGLEGIEDQINIWSSLHKLDIEIKEQINIADELIYRKMTGDLMPDMILQFQAASLPYEKEKTIAFLLQSIMVPNKNQATDTIVLPSGHKLHPDLFLSILASLSGRVSPYDPGFMKGPEGIRQASVIYFDQLLNHKVVEQDDFFLNETYRNNLFGFFPARAFHRQNGLNEALPQLQGMERPLSHRVYPLQLLLNNEMLPEGTLLDFLKLPGIQYNLLSVSCRQLPENTGALENRDLNDMEKRLYEEWKQGYILCKKNYSFRRNIERSLPDFFRAEGDLPR